MINVGQPFLSTTSYKNTFKDYGTEKKIEKAPVYPFYSLPFNGSSDYQIKYNYENIKKSSKEDPYEKTVVGEFKARMKKG